jgi:hypothetical protein
MTTRGYFQEIKVLVNSPVIRAGYAFLKKKLGSKASALDRVSYDKTRSVKLQYQSPLSFRLSIPVIDPENPTEKSEVIVQ